MRAGVVSVVKVTESSIASLGILGMVRGDGPEASRFETTIGKSRVLGKGLVNTKVVLSDGRFKE
jgi:hypothetical protein